MAIYANLSELWDSVVGITKEPLLNHDAGMGFIVTDIPVISVRLPPSADLPFSLTASGPWFQEEHRLDSGEWSVSFRYEYLFRLAQSGDKAAQEVIVRAEQIGFEETGSSASGNIRWFPKVETSPLYPVDAHMNFGGNIQNIVGLAPGADEPTP